MKRMYLGSDKKFLGVCSGISDYLGIDPVIIRIAVVCLSLFLVFIPVLVIYVLAALVLPRQPEGYTTVNVSKKLTKSQKDKKISGVCAGIAEYLGIDATIVRLIFALSVLFVGYGVMTYIVCLIMMPSKPEQFVAQQ